MKKRYDISKLIFSLTISLIIIFSNNFTSYAESEYDMGESAREYYYNEWLSDCTEDQLIYYINKLAIEYLILSDTIAITDNYIFINSDCVYRTYMQDVELVFTEDSYGNLMFDSYYEKIDFLSKHIENLFNDEIEKGFDKWWCSLGNNYTKYIYILNNIDKYTAELNDQITKYNQKTGDKLPMVPYLHRVYESWSWREAYNAYFHYGKEYQFYGDYYYWLEWRKEPDFYPQG